MYSQTANPGLLGQAAATAHVGHPQLVSLLRPLRQRLGNQLSGGQQKMLAAAWAVAARPSFPLLDEPTKGLAPLIVEQLAETVSATCAELGSTLVLVEQNIWFARKCTDLLSVLDNGSVVFGGDWCGFDADETVCNRHLALA
jgi:ABC-type branched-subunit amino acid transport system ATPase component